MAADLGKAYVQIVPSAEGIKGSITKVLSGESQSAGVSSGESFGSNMVKKIKSIVVSAGIGAALKTAVEEGAKLEQSYLGGLDTLYGKSADMMRSYADEAAKAGISANNFAEQAVSFGAALKSSFKGAEDAEAKAANAANLAILDMADNSAKMGTSIESIQNAYQGFAKQNYTMLDNLRIGYGGTKSEIQRLLKDAQKLSGVKYDLNNLADVYSAIHVIQEELGVSGVAAQEASTTLSGSLGAMKASFSNFIGNLTLGRDITPALDDLVSTSSGFLFNNLIPAVINIIKALPGSIYKAIVSYYPILKTQTLELIHKFTSYIQEGFPKILNKGTEILQNLVNGIVTNIPYLISSIGQVVTSIIDFIGENLPLIALKGYEIISNLASGIYNNMPEIIASMLNVLANIVQAIINNLPTIFAKGIEITANVASGIISAIPDLFSKVVEGFSSVDWGSIGSNIISGIINGLRNGLNALIDAATNVAKSAFNAAKNFLGIKSPSRKGTYLGKMFDAGLTKGLTGNVSMVKTAMKKVTGSMENTFDSNIASFKVNGKVEPNSSNKQGFEQTVIIQSPKALSPSEVARQTRIATKQMALKMSVGN